MKNNFKGCTISMTPFILVTLILYVLQVCGVIHTSWWLIFAPVLIFPAIIVTWFVLMFLVAIITALFSIF